MARVISDEDLRREQENPVPAYSRCTALRDFKGKESHDLPFTRGEELTIIEPCNVVFWYLAENKHGTRGVIPINFVRVHSLNQQNAPPVPPPNPVKDSASQPPPPPPHHSSPHHPSPHHPSPHHSSHPLQNGHSEQGPPPPLKRDPSSKLPSPPPLHKPLSAPPTSKNPPPPPPPKPSKSKSLPRHSTMKHMINVTRSTSTDGVANSQTSDDVVDIDSRPPAPLPVDATKRKDTPIIQRRPGKFRTNAEFCEKSGWFSPTIDNCFCKKLDMQISAFRSLRQGIFLFVHVTDPRLKFVGKSHTLYQDLISLIHRLFEKPENKLTPLEVELKYNSSEAKDWHVRVRPVVNPDLVDIEETKMMVQYRTVKPEGLNSELTFFSKDHFYAFAQWYSQYRSTAKPLF